jgi:hypothetical protein
MARSKHGYRLPDPASIPAKSEPVERWRLAQDESSHWYVIPADALSEFEEWASYTYPENATKYKGQDFTDYSLGGSPYGVTFENWRDE